MRMRPIALIGWLCLAGCTPPVRAQVRASSPAAEAVPVEVYNREFLRAVVWSNPSMFLACFPPGGEFMHVETRIDGASRVEARRSFTVATLQEDEDFFREVLRPDPEALGVGSFAFMAKEHGIHWQRVGAARFVPPGRDATSPTFVEWRRTGTRWEIAAFGDEVHLSDDADLTGVFRSGEAAIDLVDRPSGAFPCDRQL